MKSRSRRSTGPIGWACNFFDTAWAYGDGHSEQLLGRTLKRHPGQALYIATKIPPKNRKWPAGRGPTRSTRSSPPTYIREYTEKSLQNLGVSTLDLQQFHVWTDEWAGRRSLAAGGRGAQGRGARRAIGISVNRWEPANVLKALDTGLIDAVQVVYNVFDQSPEDELFPACRARTSRSSGGCPSTKGASPAR